MKEKSKEAVNPPPPVPQSETMSQEAQVNMEQFAQDAGIGWEAGKHKMSDYKVPFISIIQGLSPQKNQSSPKYNEKAIDGMLVNTVTQELIEARKSKNAQLEVVVLDRVTEYPEWKPERKGLVKVHKDESILSQTKKGTGRDENTDFLPNGNIIDTTSKWTVMVKGKDGQYYPAIIAMSRTNLKHSRAWLTMLGNEVGKKADGSTFKMPLFARHWLLSTGPEVKDQNTYFAWTNIVPGNLVVNKDTYLEIKSVHAAVASGQLALPDSSEEHQEALPANSDNAPY